MDRETDSMYKDENTPKWLKTIQLNSWEAELLISALVLYALFQVPDSPEDYSNRHFERGSYFIFIFNVLQANTFSALGFVRRVVTGVGDKLLLLNTDNLRNRIVDKSFIVRYQQQRTRIALKPFF